MVTMDDDREGGWRCWMMEGTKDGGDVDVTTVDDGDVG